MASSREVLEKVSVAFAQEFHIPYPSVSDPSGQIRDGLGFIGQPYTIFLRGRIENKSRCRDRSTSTSC
jgi:hypothetical protein